MKPQPGYIPSPYPIGTALETSILAALRSGAISYEEANAMISVSQPLCLNHNQPAVVLWDGEPCCAACLRAFVVRPVREL